MKTVASLLPILLALLTSPSRTAATPVREEHATAGNLDLAWEPGFGVSNNMKPLTLAPDHAAFANPSGDHTVACATNSAPDSGGIILTATEPAGLSDYVWEGYMFTGDGNTRRGLVVRADPTNGFASCYQFVIQSGLFQLNFRKLVNGAPTTLGTWFASDLPSGPPGTNTWHALKVIARGSSFRCFWDGYELTAAPIEDSALASGWVGAYNFRFDLGGVPALFDDLLLSPIDVTATQRATWGALKARYVK